MGRTPGSTHCRRPGPGEGAMGAGRLGNPGMGTPGMRLDSGTFQLRTCRRFSTIKMKTYLLTRRGKRGCRRKVVKKSCFGFLCWAPFWGKGSRSKERGVLNTSWAQMAPSPGPGRLQSVLPGGGGGRDKGIQGTPRQNSKPPPGPTRGPRTQPSTPPPRGPSQTRPPRANPDTGLAPREG